MVLTVVVSIFFWQHLFDNRNIQAIPNPDIFQYIGDGYQYLRSTLPKSIHPPPLGPIMITSFAQAIKTFTIHPEIEAAKFINITLASLTLINIYILSSIFIPPLHAFLLSVLVATNQINILYSMDVTNDVIYAFFLSLVLILYQYQKKFFVYLLFGLLFLIRYESIVIPISVFIIEYYSPKQTLKIKNILLSFVPIVLWLIILNFHARTGNSILGNAYIEEMINGIQNIPNPSVFVHLFEIVTFDNKNPNNLTMLFLLVTLGLCYRGIVDSKSKPLLKIIYLTFILNLLFIYIFPNFSVRYYIPIIWITYFILANQKSKIVSLTVLLCFLTYNLARINIPTNYSQPKDMLEYRLVADWINKTTFKKSIIVLIYEPHILKYYVANKKVYVPYDTKTPFAPCHDNIVCISQNFLSKTKFDEVMVITTSYTYNSAFFQNDKFTPTLHHINSFNDKNFSNNVNFKYITTLISDDKNNWANIWTYVPSSNRTVTK